MQFLKVMIFCGLTAAVAVPDPIAASMDIIAARAADIGGPDKQISDHKKYCKKHPSALDCTHDSNAQYIKDYCAAYKKSGETVPKGVQCE